MALFFIHNMSINRIAYRIQPKLRPVLLLSTKKPSRGDSLGKGFDLFEESDAQRSAVRAFGERSFQINDVLVRSSVLLFPKSFLIWNAKKPSDIDLESLLLFPILYPTLEIVFVGLGETFQAPLPADITSYFKAKGIVLEASSSVNAASSFNVLNGEGRNVGAALLTLEETD